MICGSSRLGRVRTQYPEICVTDSKLSDDVVTVPDEVKDLGVEGLAVEGHRSRSLGDPQLWLKACHLGTLRHRNRGRDRGSEATAGEPNSEALTKDGATSLAGDDPLVGPAFPGALTSSTICRRLALR